MKIKYTSIVGILAVLVLIASFVVPAKLANPEPVAADPGLMEWTPVTTPDIEVNQTKQLYSPTDGKGASGTIGNNGSDCIEEGSELRKLLVGNNGTSMYVLTTIYGGATGTDWSKLRIMKSMNGGQSWVASIQADLAASVGVAPHQVLVWDAAIAPDDPNIIIAAISLLGDENHFWVWISTNGGSSWDDTNWGPGAGVAADGEYPSALDISMDFGSRMALVGTRDGAVDNLNIWTMKIPGFGGWKVQNTGDNPFVGDVIDAKFSPTFNGDSTIVVLWSDAAGTYVKTGWHDISINETDWQMDDVEIMNQGANDGDSPWVTEIITGMLQLPSDFSGQAASLKRIYVSTDAKPDRGTVNDGVPNMGVYRIDDNIIYTLMDNSGTFKYQAQNLANRRAASIAYWGTYASGKLLVGMRLGDQCTASVPVYFTDSPTVCPVPCWYPSKKPPTGAAGCYSTCKPGNQGYGNAYVVWSPTFAAQGVAYAVTGASSLDGAYAAIGATGQTAAPTWPAAYYNLMALDESAFSLTRNNGETWNQLSLIDTRIIKLTDVAPSPDCSTVYLASINNATCDNVTGLGDANCSGFDSIWRSSTNEAVVAPPLPALPIGSIWERVRAHVTALNCSEEQNDYIIIRLAPDKLDGQVVAWAAGGGNWLKDHTSFWPGSNYPGDTKMMEWSPDFGDYWALMNPRIEVQDFAFETSTILYVLSEGGKVQKMPYTGTAWASSIANVSSPTRTGHTIEAMAPDKVLVASDNKGGYPVGISMNGATSFAPMVQPIPGPAANYHAIFDTDFAKNSMIYVGSDASSGVVFRNTAPAGSNTPWTDMMQSQFTYIGYIGPHTSYFGLAQTNSKNITGQGTLYAAHDDGQGSVSEPTIKGPVGTVNDGNPSTWSGVERTLAPLDGIPKPGLEWSCLDAKPRPFQVNTPLFTLEPKSLKFCGCLTEDTNTTLYAIDNAVYSNNHNKGCYGVSGVKTTGLLWAYTDCVAKKGPKLTMADGTIIGCDPATGRNQEVNFTWEQLCIANEYQVKIAKDKAFTLAIWNAVIAPADVTSPALVYLAGGEGTYPAVFYDPDKTGFAGVAASPSLECGHTYYWKVRVWNETTNDYVISPWSEVRGFTIKAGFKVTTPYYGPQLLAPDNGCGCACSAPVCFSWSPFKETTEYKFELSENADMSSPLVSTAVPGTAYQFTGTVKCNKNYFWRVMATKPAPSEWSATFSFMTQPEPPKPTPPPAPAPEVTPLWVWVVIGIGALLFIVILVLIFKTRRV